MKTYPALYPGFYPSLGTPGPPTPLPVATAFELGAVLPDPAPGDFLSGMTYANNGRQLVILTNTTILEQSCRVVFPYPVRGRTIPPLVIDVGGSARVLAGPYDPTVFGDQLLIIPSAPTFKVSVIQRA